MTDEILSRFASHKPLLDANVTVDLVFAFGERDEDGNLLTNALNKNGIPALGITRKISLKDRALGRADAEIALDGDWWQQKSSEEQQAALLDHELHHIACKMKKGQFCYDNLGRPELKLRKHDVEVGWFACIAERHGANSVEQIQAKIVLDRFGQYLFPSLVASNTTAVSRSSKTK